MKRIICPLLASLLAGCATTTYAPLAGVPASNFDVAKAECSISSRHANDAPLYGPTGAQLGQAMMQGISAAIDFKDCMTVHGWTVVAGQ